MKNYRHSLSFIAFTLIVLSALSCKKENILKSDAAMTFEQVAAKDYRYMQGVDTKAFYFYEIECTLNGSVAKMDAEDVRVLSTCTVSGTEENNVYFIHTDLTTGEERVEIVENDRWMGDFDMGDPARATISFAKAVKMLQEQKVYEVPDSDLCTFSQPTSGLILNPRYIFGSVNKGFVYVDSVTGEIGKMVR